MTIFQKALFTFLIFLMEGLKFLDVSKIKINFKYYTFDLIILVIAVFSIWFAYLW